MFNLDFLKEPSFDTVSQSAHVWFAGWFVYTFHLFGNQWLGTLILLALAAVKEFWFDQNYETPEIRGSNAKDFFFYGVGAIITAWILTFAK